jgi:amino acid transporter
MVGAGFFSLLGAAGEVAGAAVWLSFVLAGCIAGLQGYSFAKLGAKYPSAGGLRSSCRNGGSFSGRGYWCQAALMFCAEYAG